MKKLSLLTAFLAVANFNAQFVSPGTGVTYNLNSLATAAGENLINHGSYFQITKDITISNGDKLQIDENTTLKVNSGVTIFIFGEFMSNSDNLLITNAVENENYKGIRFEETSKTFIKNTTIEKGTGIRVNSTNFIMDNCIVRDIAYGGNTGIGNSGAITFGTNISPTIKNSNFTGNQYPALGSAANGGLSAIIDNNYFFGNSKNNTNRPQLNFGPGGSDTLRIVNNTILGDRNLPIVGGIAVSALLGNNSTYVIANNIVKDNRYGIAISGAGSVGVIENNIIENNNTQNNPNLGGSGINLLGAGMTQITKNEIRGNLWGITLQSNAKANLGSDLPGEENVGLNIFKNNINNGVDYALFNNGNQNISAKFNCWREDELSDNEMVEQVITHKVDNPNYGTVTFSPYKCAKVLAVNDISKLKTSIYPNPSNGQFNIKTDAAANIIVSDLTGRTHHTSIIKKGDNHVNVNLKSGVYILTVVSDGQQTSHKIIIK